MCFPARPEQTIGPLTPPCSLFSLQSSLWFCCVSPPPPPHFSVFKLRERQSLASSMKTGEIAVLHFEANMTAASPWHGCCGRWPREGLSSPRSFSESPRNFSDHQHLNTGCSGTSCAETSPSDFLWPGNFWSPLGPQARGSQSKFEQTRPVRLEVSEGAGGIHLLLLQSSLVEFFFPDRLAGLSWLQTSLSPGTH